MAKKHANRNVISDLFAGLDEKDVSTNPPRVMQPKAKTKSKNQTTRKRLPGKIQRDGNATERYFKDVELAARFKVARQTIWRWVKLGSFPPPTKIAPNTSRWRESDVLSYERGL